MPNGDENKKDGIRLDDIEALAIGNKTDCCFTVLGNGYSCLSGRACNLFL